MEWRVENANSQTEVVHRTALIQLADSKRIVLIHLAQMQGKHFLPLYRTLCVLIPHV